MSIVASSGITRNISLPPGWPLRGLPFISERLMIEGHINWTNAQANFKTAGTHESGAATFNGAVTLAGDGKAWVGVDLTPTAIKHPSANGPGSTEYESIYYDAYDSGAMEQIFYLWHIPEDFAVSAASVRGHFGLMVATPPTDPDPTEVVAMGFEYFKFSSGEVNTFAADGGGALDINIVMDETAYTWHESATGVCNTTGWATGDLVIFRFFRDIAAEYSANDDFDGGDALLGAYHLEYLVDSLGEAV